MKRDRKARKSNRFDIRFTDDEMDMLDYLSEKKQLPKSVIIRDALKMYYKSTKYNEAYYEQYHVPF